MSKKIKNKSEYIKKLNFWFAYANCIPYIYSQEKNINQEECNGNILKYVDKITSFFCFLSCVVAIGLILFAIFKYPHSVQMAANHDHVVCYEESDIEKRNGEYYYRENKTLLRKAIPPEAEANTDKSNTTTDNCCQNGVRHDLILAQIIGGIIGIALGLLIYELFCRYNAPLHAQRELKQRALKETKHEN